MLYARTIITKNYSMKAHDGEPLDPSRTGLARELSRMSLSLNFYTHWYWKVDLHNLLNFLSLRADPHAQYEIRVYAEAVLDTRFSGDGCHSRHQAFLDYRLNSRSLSAPALSVVRTALRGRREGYSRL